MSMKTSVGPSAPVSTMQRVADATLPLLPVSGGLLPTQRGRVLRARPTMTMREVRSLRHADELVAAGQTKKALAHLRRLVRDVPQSVPGYLRIANLLREACRGEEAIRVLNSAVSQAPNDPDPREALSEICLELGRWDEAIVQGRALLTLSPRSLFARDVLSAAYLQRGLIDHALRVTDEMILLDPNDPGNHFKRGVLMQQKGQIGGAIRAFLRVMQMEPDSEVAQESRTAVEMLDTFQLRQIVSLAVEDVPFRLRLMQNCADAVHERGYFLSERGVATLAQVSFENLPSAPPGWRQYIYN